MNAIKENSNGTLEAVRAAVKRHGASREELIPILTDINKSVGFLPAEALEEISRLIHVPRSQLFSVATFYRMLSTKKMGRHVIQFCESAPCHVVGGRQVWEALQSELGLEAGETSPDDRWTLVTVSCLGVCGIGPVVVIDDDMYGNVTPEQIPGILARYA
jgi:NADH:ubiquinone oxidoreductase subunit E